MLKTQWVKPGTGATASELLAASGQAELTGLHGRTELQLLEPGEQLTAYDVARVREALSRVGVEIMPLCFEPLEGGIYCRMFEGHDGYCDPKEGR
jgi:hypothetical protein